MNASVLQLEQVTKRFGTVTALDGIDLRIGRGELLAVVGPSGCGKSTLLRSIAGLASIDAGRIHAGDRELVGPTTFVPPEKREIGVVFQDLALFPHLDVAGNVAFGLGRSQRRDRVAEVLDLVGLAGMAARYPHELSGGEQQRVALARALAPRPIAILLDEPFSHLDRNLRTEVRQHTVEVLRDDGATGVFVTHDQEEAMVAADRVAILRSGRIQQIGSPREVFHAPTSRFVATFLGDADFLPGLRSGTQVDTVLGPLPVTEAGSGSCQVMVRPHDLTIDEDEDGPALVERVEFYGAVLVHHVLLHDGSRVRAMSPHTERVEAGARVRVRPLLAHRLIAFPSPGEA